MGLTIKELIPIGEKILADAGAGDYKIDAEALLGYAIGFDRKKIFMNWIYEVDDARSEKYFDLVNRRAAGEPLQYIIGVQCFMGHNFIVTPDVLIPRPETEGLAEKAISWLQAHSNAKAALDLCTGSGALAVTIALECPRLRVSASDISGLALGVAKRNALALGVAGRIEFFHSDLFAGIRQGVLGKTYDVIVTNPPYIRTADLAGLQREIREHEPLSALDGGADGLDFYRRIAEGAGAYLRPGGCLMAEIAHDQAKDASSIFGEAGFKNIEIFQDLAGLDRVLKTDKAA